MSSEAWMYRSAGLLADSWISEAFALDTDVLTKALQKSLSENLPPPADPSSSSSYFNNTEIPEQTFSGSGSDFETLNPPKRSRNTTAVSATGGKITKRKSRACKRNMTTFITADPANFRQMVQQVTGVKLGNGIQIPVTSSVPSLKPETQWASSDFNNRFQGCLPTLDTSAFLLDHHNNKQQSMGTSSTPTIDQSPPAVADDGGSGFQLGSFVSFPTLESWN